MAYPTVTKIRVYPRNGWTARLTGARVYGSNTSPTADRVLLHTLSEITEGIWNEQTISGASAYKYLIVGSKAGEYLDCAELEFYAGATKISPVSSGGSIGYLNEPSLAPANVFDGDTSTIYGSNDPDTAYLYIETADSGGGGNQAIEQVYIQVI